MARWAWRLFRREWRQQILVLALLTLTVAAAAFSVSAAYNVASLPGPQFGSASHLLQFGGTSPKTLAADIAAARKAFGTIQVIGRRFVPIPGSAQTVEFRAQNPHGPYSGPMIALTQGRYPSGAGQAAVTGQLAQTLQLRIGSPLSLGGHHQTVTGIVENPSDLNDQFVLVTPSARGPAAVGDGAAERQPRQFRRLPRPIPRPAGLAGAGRQHPGELSPAARSALVTVLLLLVSLVAAAGFAVIAARRQRQLGMLAAIGATRKQLRMVMVAGGAVVGVIAAAAGTVVGLAAWIAAAPALDAFAGHRIDRFAIPWDLVALGMLLAVVTATAAAWWPARAAARLPVTLALSARPPRPRPAHRPALLAALMIVAGVACLALANQTRPPLIIAGALAMALGILLISPLAIRALAALARRAPVAVRLALRDLARHQARSGAALAAISLALGITAAIIISSAADKTAASAGNLPDTQIAGLDRPARRRKWPGWSGRPDPDARPAGRPGRRGAPDRRIAAPPRRDRPRHARQPGRQAAARRPGQPGRTAGRRPGRPAEPGRRGRGGTYSALPLYVATPAVLRYLGISPATITPATDIPHRPGGAARGHHTSTFADRHPRAADPGPRLHLRSPPR